MAHKNVKAAGKTQTTPKSDKSGEQVHVVECDVVIPESADAQQLAAMVFAEADATREQDDEREAIAWVMINRRRHNDTYSRDGLGGATIWGVVSASDSNGYQFRGYGNHNWNLVMAGQALKPQVVLRKLDQTDTGRKPSGVMTSCESFKRCVAVANAALREGAEPSDPRYRTFVAYQLANPNDPNHQSGGAKNDWRMDQRPASRARWDNKSATLVGTTYFITWLPNREDPNPSHWNAAPEVGPMTVEDSEVPPQAPAGSNVGSSLGDEGLGTFPDLGSGLLPGGTL